MGQALSIASDGGVGHGKVTVGQALYMEGYW